MRLIVSLLMIPGVLLTQFAAVPHTHASGQHEPTGHQSHPHFHFHLFRPTESARNVPIQCTSPACSAPQIGTDNAPPDHDSDAVYVESATATAEREKPRADVHCATPLPVFLFSVRDLEPRARLRPLSRSAAAHTSVRCPLYVRFLALTI